MYWRSPQKRMPMKKKARELKCVNCKEDVHPANFRGCTVYLQLQGKCIQNIQTTIINPQLLSIHSLFKQVSPMPRKYNVLLEQATYHNRHSCHFTHTTIKLHDWIKNYDERPNITHVYNDEHSYSTC